ncbi:MAG: TonB-dependent receptor, partial [Bacteroidales bacterium]|nr:TonB-dependent receptor [Bacteroidales bacterium]
FDKGTKPVYSNSRSRSTGFLLSANYAYKGRYMIDLNYRLDGSSVFGAQKMFTGTWSLGAAWDITNEKWFKAEWISFLKVRYSIGNPGNQNFDAYMSSGIYEYNPDYTNIFGESAILSKAANRNLAWQKTLDQNWGLDFTAWQDRIRLTFDYYHKNTNPLLVSITLPPSAGQTRAYTNLGGQISQGFSGILNVIALKTETMRLGVNFSFSHNTSRYVDIGNSLEFMNQHGSSEVFRRYYDGASPDDIWAVRSLGIDPATGREIFLTRTGEYTFQYNAEDEVKVGSTAPDLEGIIGMTFYYKRFSASINCRYQAGGQIFASALYNKVENLSEQQLYYNVDRRALYDRWQKPGDNAMFKAIDNLDTTPMSSRFVLDNNVFSFESISVGYDTNAKWLQKIRVQGASIRLYANNIWRISSVKEERGIEYPFANSVSMSISLRF